MNFDIWRGMIEFASDIQQLNKDGWTFKHQYGEQRLGINDSIVFTKGDRMVTVYDESDLYRLLESIHNKE